MISLSNIFLEYSKRANILMGMKWLVGLSFVFISSRTDKKWAFEARQKIRSPWTDAPDYQSVLMYREYILYIRPELGVESFLVTRKLREQGSVPSVFIFCAISEFFVKRKKLSRKCQASGISFVLPRLVSTDSVRNLTWIIGLLVSFPCLFFSASSFRSENLRRHLECLWL